jgi:hypothetical protein
LLNSFDQRFNVPLEAKKISILASTFQQVNHLLDLVRQIGEPPHSDSITFSLAQNK